MERDTSEEVFKKVKGRRILVTGGAGFVGSHMCDRLIRHGAMVVCLDDLSNGKRGNIIHHMEGSPNFSFEKADVNDYQAAYDVFRRFKPNWVFHYAALVGVNRASRDTVGVLRDIDGIKNIANLSREFNVSRVLFTSSSEVYGEPEKLPTAETDKLSSHGLYGLVKIIGERMLQEFSKTYGIPITLVRYFNVYGPRQDYGESGFLVASFLRNVRDGKPMQVFGDGSQTRDLVYVEDNVRLTLKAVLTPAADGCPMNIGSGCALKVIDLAKAIKNLVPGAEFAHASLRKDGEILLRQPDVSFMKRALNDWPVVSLEEGLKRTLKSMG